MLLLRMCLPKICHLMLSFFASMTASFLLLQGEMAYLGVGGSEGRKKNF